MSTKGLSFKEICAIIKIASSNGVSHLKLGDLDVAFHALAPMQLSPPNPEPQFKTEVVEPISAVSETSEDFEDFKHAQDLITDPEAYENEQINNASKE